MAKDPAKKKARRSKLPLPTEVPAPAEQQQEQQAEVPVPPPNAYTFRLEMYTADCFVDTYIMLEKGISLARGTFLDARNLEVRVDVPTDRFFELHTLDPHASFLWESLCLEGYFALPPWGPDLQRAWELITTLDDQNYFKVTDLQGNQQKILLNRKLIRKALHLPDEDLVFNDKALKRKDRENCADQDEPRWDQLKQQAIRMALQLYMQHFHLGYPHRWTTPDKLPATQFTKKEITSPDLRNDYAQEIVSKIKRAAKSVISQGKSTAKRISKPYLGGPLLLTRIAYTALELDDDELPPPWAKPDDERVGSRSQPGSRSHKSTTEPPGRTPITRKRSQKAQSVPQEDVPKDVDPVELEEAIKLSRSEGAKSVSDAKKGQASSQARSTLEQHEDEDLREAIRRSLLDLSIKPTVGYEQDYYYAGSMFSPEDMSRVRQVLIQFSQDPEAVLALHRGLEMLREERVKLQEAEEARKRKQEADKKRLEDEEAKKKGKEKFGETSGVDKVKSPSPIRDQGGMDSPMREPEMESHLLSWKKLQQWRE